MQSHICHFCNELYNNSFAFAISGNWLNLAMRSSRVKTAYGPQDRRVDQLPTIALTAVHLPSPRIFPYLIENSSALLQLLPSYAMSPA